jgi:hypothetical protein
LPPEKIERLQTEEKKDDDGKKTRSKSKVAEKPVPTKQEEKK